MTRAAWRFSCPQQTSAFKMLHRGAVAKLQQAQQPVPYWML
jgi:hypothetical protein